MEIKSVEVQAIPCPIPGIHLVAVLGKAPDGWRCYEAAYLFPSPVDDTWATVRESAVAFTLLQGRKIPPEQARKYFMFSDDLKFA